MNEVGILIGMSVALAAGMVIGLERGWHERNLPDGSRVAGIRTFSLVSLSGGLTSIIGQELSPFVAAAVALALAGLLVAVRVSNAKDPDRGATTEVAAVVAFSLGALAGLGHWVPTMAGAVVTALLLGLKPLLHHGLRVLDQRELMAALQFVLISAVILPLLPDAGFGPFEALNPYRLWLMVVLIAGVSSVGYVGMRIFKAQSGLMLTGIFGGLASSTATTLALARRGADVSPALWNPLAAGIVAANTMMLLRVSLLLAIVHPPLLGHVAAPIGGAVMIGLAATTLLWRSGAKDAADGAAVRPGNPLDLKAAVGFGAVLAVIMVTVEACRATLGSPGLYGLSAVAGLIDTDAIALSLADQAQRQLAEPVAAMGLIIAVSVNSAVKAIIVWFAGPRPVAWRTVCALAAMILSGACAVMVMGS